MPSARLRLIQSDPERKNDIYEEVKEIVNHRGLIGKRELWLRSCHKGLTLGGDVDNCTFAKDLKVVIRNERRFV